jgi:hypothetical protein
MWVKLTPTELGSYARERARRERRTRYKGAAIAAVYALALATVLAGFHQGDPGLHGGSVGSWEAFKANIWISLSVAAALWLVFGILFVFFWDGTFRGAQWVICLQCDKGKDEDGIKLCACGAEFVRREEWRWVEDEAPAPTISTARPDGLRVEYYEPKRKFSLWLGSSAAAIMSLIILPEVGVNIPDGVVMAVFIATFVWTYVLWGEFLLLNRFRCPSCRKLIKETMPASCPPGLRRYCCTRCRVIWDTYGNETNEC